MIDGTCTKGHIPWNLKLHPAVLDSWMFCGMGMGRDFLREGK